MRKMVPDRFFIQLSLKTILSGKPEIVSFTSNLILRFFQFVSHVSTRLKTEVLIKEVSYQKK